MKFSRGQSLDERQDAALVSRLAVGSATSLGFGMALFGGTYGLGALAIFIARFVFYRRDAIKE